MSIYLSVCLYEGNLDEDTEKKNLKTRHNSTSTYASTHIKQYFVTSVHLRHVNWMTMGL